MRGRSPLSGAGAWIQTGVLTLTILVGTFLASPSAQEYVRGFTNIVAQTITAGTITATGVISTPSTVVGGNIQSQNTFFVSSAGVLQSPHDGWWQMTNFAGSIGSTFKIDALPTVSSGFGTSPAVLAGSTPYAGGVNVGTGGVAVTGILNFNGFAYPSAPFCTASETGGNFPVIVNATTTQLTLTVGAAWAASTVVNWNCPSSK